MTELAPPSWPRLGAAAVEQLRLKLGRVLGDSKLLVGAEAMLAFAGDESAQEPVSPDAVVIAETASDIVETFAVAAELGAPVTPRGAGTGKSGGAVPVYGGVVLDTSKMCRILEIDRQELVAVVEPGVVLHDLHQAVEAENLFYPPDPNSQMSCLLGGNIAENAGGPRAFKYGVTRDYVLGLEVVTAEGTALSLGRRTVKGVTGYDLTALLVGSEGTLAVTTAATLRLRIKPPHVMTILGLFDHGSQCAEAVTLIVAAGIVPRCLEFLDGACLAAMRAEGVAIDARAQALLLIEVDGDEALCERDMQRVGECADEAGAIEVVVAQGASQRDRLWAVRRELSHVTRRMARFKISEDVVVPRRHIATLIEEVSALSERTGIRMLTYGHAGDGNIHVNFLWDDPALGARIASALDELFQVVIRLGGTLTGEHGVGTTKARFLHLEQSAEVIALQRRLKAQFDPKGILNPGKIFPRRSHGSC